jgi:folate-binding protein YgfZ
MDAAIKELFCVDAPEAHGVVRVEFQGDLVTILGVGLVEESGVRVIGPQTALEAIENRIDATSVSDAVMNALRVEAGWPCGSDYGAKTTPAELGLNAAVSHTKGCYLGQEIVARMKTYGAAPKRLVGLRSDTVMETGEEVSLVDKVVGKVGSWASAEALGGSIALTVLPRTVAVAGTEVVVAGRPATVVPLPFVEGGRALEFEALGE